MKLRSENNDTVSTSTTQDEGGFASGFARGLGVDDKAGFFGRSLYIYLALLAAIPIWVMINKYVQAIHVHEDELVASAATACFLFGVFAGRYIAQMWTVKMTQMPKAVLVTLCTLILTCIAWLFFHADFPFEKRVALNLLLFWIPFAITSLALGVLIKILRAFTENELKAARAAAAASKTELHLLQSQLSPHFLFNTLNNLYGLSLTQHEKIPPLLLKLSELLRYSVYDAAQTYVPLTEELSYINNYIDFEKIRIGDRLQLHTELEAISGNDIKIAPMLLIVFIENAFKHSKNTADEKIFIEITLKTWGNSILFSVKNSFDKAASEKKVSGKNNGFGLVSVSKRLDLLYNNEHSLEVEQSNGYYSVMLQLKMRR